MVLQVEPGDFRVGPPHQTPDPDPPLRELLEDGGELHIIDQVLVGVASPVGEMHLVPGLKRAKIAVEPLEIGATMDQGFDVVAGGIRETARMSPVDLGGVVPAFIRSEEPSLDRIVRHRRSLPSVLSGRWGTSGASRAWAGVQFGLVDHPLHDVLGDILPFAFLRFFRLQNLDSGRLPGGPVT